MESKLMKLQKDITEARLCYNKVWLERDVQLEADLEQFYSEESERVKKNRRARFLQYKMKFYNLKCFLKLLSNYES